MSYFRVIPNALQTQRDELDAVYRNLCQDMAEVSRVIRRLAEMTSFDDPIESLLRVQRKAGDQEVKLRQCANALQTAADLYTRAELKNLDGTIPASFHGPAEPLTILWDRKMVPNVETLFGTKAVIPQND